MHIFEEDEQRQRITLLDWVIVEQLHEAIFDDHYGGPRVLTDLDDRLKWLVLGSAGSMTPTSIFRQVKRRYL